MTASFAAGSALIGHRVIPAPRTPDPAERWQLVVAAQQGDRQAFADLYRLYHPIVLRFVTRRTPGRPQLAEDIAADVFVRALRNIGSITWQGRDPGAWLITIARNMVLDHYKSSRARLEFPTDDLAAMDRADRNPEGDPAAAVADHDRNLTVWAAVRQLRPGQQECIRLRFLDGLSVAETAAAMGRDVGAVKALQYRAVRQLARLLDGQGV